MPELSWTKLNFKKTTGNLYILVGQNLQVKFSKASNSLKICTSYKHVIIKSGAYIPEKLTA